MPGKTRSKEVQKGGKSCAYRIGGQGEFEITQGHTCGEIRKVPHTESRRASRLEKRSLKQRQKRSYRGGRRKARRCGILGRRGRAEKKRDSLK